MIISASNNQKSWQILSPHIRLYMRWNFTKVEQNFKEASSQFFWVYSGILIFLGVPPPAAKCSPYGCVYWFPYTNKEKIIKVWEMYTQEIQWQFPVSFPLGFCGLFRRFVCVCVFYCLQLKQTYSLCRTGMEYTPRPDQYNSHQTCSCQFLVFTQNVFS